MAFADDTTAVGKLKDKEMIDQCIQRVLADHAEKVHPGKREWMAMGMKQDTSTLGDGLSKHVRLLGGWVDMDGGVEKDNVERKKAARMTWLRLTDAVLRAKISLKTKGRIIKATVIATLLYGSEARFFRKKDVAEYQNFVDRVCRALVFSTTKLTIRRMEGKVTMQDLRNMVGFPMIEEMITRRQYQYLGHLGRYNKNRIEARMLNSWLQIDGNAPPKRLKNTKMTVRSQYWKLITELMKNTEIQQEEWPEKWRNVAQDGKLWKKLAEIEIKKVAVNAETSTWTEKHAEGSELLAPPPHKRADESDISGFVRCEKYGENVHPNGYRVHLRTCQGTENRGRARRKFVQCERCNGWFSRILRHMPNCAGPGARGRGRSNRGEIQMLNPGVREEETNSTRRRLRGKQRNPEEVTRRKKHEWKTGKEFPRS